MKHKKIICIIEHLDVGGEENLVLTLMPALRGFNIIPYVATFIPGSQDKALKAKGVHLINLKSRFKIFRIIELVKIFRTIKPDIIHTRLFSAGFWGRIAGFLYKDAAIIHTHAGFTFRSKRLKRIPVERLLLPLTDALICVSESVRKHIEKTLKISKEKICVIPNGVEIKKHIQIPYRKLRKPVKLIVAGRLENVKGQDILLKGFSLMPDDYCMELLIAGDGSKAMELRELATNIGIAKKVRFLGVRDDIPALLADSDIYAAPSRSEGLPVALLEAMASGMPVIASDIEAHREVLDGAGNFFPSEDYNALAAQLKKVIDNPEESIKKAKKCRARAINNFSFQKMVNAHLNLYDRYWKSL